MSHLQTSTAPLRTAEGELLQLSVAVDLCRLESMLATLGQLGFPVNPQIVHPPQPNGTVVVQFPAYERKMPSVVVSLEQAGFDRASISIHRAFAS